MEPLTSTRYHMLNEGCVDKVRYEMYCSLHARKKSTRCLAIFAKRIEQQSIERYLFLKLPMHDKREKMVDLD